MAHETDRNEGKFTEPRSWAVKWSGYALRDRGPRALPERMQEATFSKPRGWASKWCGWGLRNGTER